MYRFRFKLQVQSLLVEAGLSSRFSLYIQVQVGNSRFSLYIDPGGKLQVQFLYIDPGGKLQAQFLYIQIRVGNFRFCLNIHRSSWETLGFNVSSIYIDPVGKLQALFSQYIQIQVGNSSFSFYIYSPVGKLQVQSLYIDPGGKL